MTDQIAFETTEFADNPEPRCPCLLLLDVSASMSGAPIAELNAGLEGFRNELAADSLATKRVEIGMVTFGPVATELEFQTAEHFQPPTLNTKRDTPMGGAILHALKMIEQRKQDYRDNGVSYYRPWVFMITDGSPTDDWQAAAAAIQEGEAAKSFAFFPIGVGGADIETLKQISSREPLMLDGLRFGDLFSWLSNSLRSVSQSTPGTEVQLESPSGWAAV